MGGGCDQREAKEENKLALKNKDHRFILAPVHMVLDQCGSGQDSNTDLYWGLAEEGMELWDPKNWVLMKAI